MWFFIYHRNFDTLKTKSDQDFLDDNNINLNIDILGFPEVIKSPKLIEKFNKNELKQNINMVKNK